MVDRDIDSELLGCGRILTDTMISESHIRLDRCTECQVGREGVVHEGDAPGSRMLGDDLGRAAATDPTAVDLHVADLAVIDKVLGHRDIVCALAPCCAHGASSGTKRRICVEGGGVEGLLDPGRCRALQGWKARRSSVDIFAPYLSSID